VKTRDFSFDLPEGLIAQVPVQVRGTSRMLVLDSRTGRIEDAWVAGLAGYLAPGTVIVLNDTRVRKARLYGRSADTGGRVELLLLEEADPYAGVPLPGEGDLRGEAHRPGEKRPRAAAGPGVWRVLAGRARRLRPGRVFLFPGGVRGTVVGREGDWRLVRFEPPVTDAYLEAHGRLPLPPYIRREATPEDEERYQTVYARRTGSAAAPTAGLHLTPEILDSLRRAGMRIVSVTLNVGLGTFLPIRSEEVEDHLMHTERYEVPEETARLVTEARRQGRDVLAVGTTTVRTLESAWREEEGPAPDGGAAGGDGLRPGAGQTSLFIFPGYRFRVVTRLLTNFHTPESSLLLLVAAFAGRENILRAYGEAIAKGYRFFSYGDAMLIR
jgi:S-adenosylmethionine:tRNA ribosyltransferase-isomerase